MVVARRGHEDILPWICLSCLTDGAAEACAEAKLLGTRPQRTYMLTDGAALGLGELLRKVELGRPEFASGFKA